MGGGPGLQAKQADQERERAGVLNDIFIISCFTSCPSEKLSKVWQKVQYI